MQDHTAGMFGCMQCIYCVKTCEQKGCQVLDQCMRMSRRPELVVGCSHRQLGALLADCLTAVAIVVENADVHCTHDACMGVAVQAWPVPRCISGLWKQMGGCTASQSCMMDCALRQRCGFKQRAACACVHSMATTMVLPPTQWLHALAGHMNAHQLRTMQLCMAEPVSAACCCCDWTHGARRVHNCWNQVICRPPKVDCSSLCCICSAQHSPAWHVMCVTQRLEEGGGEAREDRPATCVPVTGRPTCVGAQCAGTCDIVTTSSGQQLQVQVGAGSAECWVSLLPVGRLKLSSDVELSCAAV